MSGDTLIAVLPMRGLADGKSRLRDIMPDRVRRAVVLSLLERTARAVLDSGTAKTVLAISPEHEVMGWAERLGLTPLQQANAGLNEALTQATIWARERNFTSLLALQADLPLITAEDVRALVNTLDFPPSSPSLGKGPGSGAMIVVGDRHNLGTTALLLRPLDTMPFHFGDQSFTRHLVAGEARGLRTQAYASRALGFDLDTPTDVAALAAWHPLAFVELCRAVGRWLPQIPQSTTPAPPRPAEEQIL